MELAEPIQMDREADGSNSRTARFWKIQAGVLALLTAGLYPLFQWCKLPPRMEIGRLAAQFFFGNGGEALSPLLAFYLIQKPADFAQVFRSRGLAGLVLALGMYLWWLSGGHIGQFATNLSLGLLAIYGYSMLGRSRIRASRFIPVVYLFAGLLIAFSYINIASATLDYAKYDAAFLAADRVLLLGHTVGEFSHWMLAFPHMGTVLEIIYEGLFGAMAATQLWLVFEGRHGAAMDFSCDVITSYLITLVAYCAMPSVGPFIFSPSSASIDIVRLQNVSMPYLSALRANHGIFAGPGSSYFVAFPCMHIVQSILVAWHLRPWPRLYRASLIFNAAMVVAILGLQQHYVVDMLGGFVVVYMAIKGREALQRPRD